MNQAITDKISEIILLKGEVPSPHHITGNVQVEVCSPRFRSSGYPMQPPRKTEADVLLRTKAASMGSNAVMSIKYLRKHSRKENVLIAQGVAVSLDAAQLGSLTSDAEETEDESTAVFTEEILLDEMRRSGLLTIFWAIINSTGFLLLYRALREAPDADVSLAVLFLVVTICMLILGLMMIFRFVRSPGVLVLDSIMLIIVGLLSLGSFWWWIGLFQIGTSIYTLRSFYKIGKEIEEEKRDRAPHSKELPAKSTNNT